MRVPVVALLLVVFLPLAALSQVSVTLGERVTLLADQALGLRYFPDGAVSVIQRKPTFRLLLTAGVKSYLVEGPDLQSLNRARVVLAPGKPGEFDNGYAGISSVYRHHDGKFYAVYHAEDQEEMRPIGGGVGVPGFYCQVGMAVSSDEGEHFTKLGAAIVSAQVKDPSGMPDQGCGEVCTVLEKSGTYLYAYYVDHSRVEGRGVQIFLARSRIDDSPPLPGTWKKYYKGKFDEDGLGGRDTQVMSARNIGADAAFPHVTYSGALEQYVMVFNINAWREYVTEKEDKRAEQSGICVAFSDDGISWSEPQKLITIFSVAVMNEEVGWHPALIWDSAESLEGWLVYAYSPSMGHGNPSGIPHYMVGQRISFTRPTSPG